MVSLSAVKVVLTSSFHDKVQSSLYRLLESEEQREALHLRIGKLLLERSREVPHDGKVVFYAAEQWNRGSKLAKQNYHDTELLLQINILAAGLAVARSSFDQGCEYYSNAIALVDPDEIWTSRYGFAVELFSNYAEALNHNGSFDECISICQDILTRASSIREKLHAYRALAISLGVQGRLDEAVNVGSLVLRRLGVKIHPRPTMLHAAAEVIKTLKAMRSKTDNDILNLPRMADWKKIAAMKMMSNIIMLIYMNDSKKNAFVIMGLRMMLLSCKFGLSSMTPYGLANYALVLVMLGRHDEACRIGWLALQLVDQLGANEVPTSVILNHLCFIGAFQ